MEVQRKTFRKSFVYTLINLFYVKQINLFNSLVIEFVDENCMHIKNIKSSIVKNQ